MILVGDQIDSSLGVRFGISTMAAAALGNLISDVIGISLGEVIEAWVARFITAPPLLPEQLSLQTTRLVKGSANIFGISIGCLLGMAPLLFLEDRKPVYFDDDEMALFHGQFAPYGVTPQQFFALLHHGKWRTAEAGTTIVSRGSNLRSVFLIHEGSAHAHAHDENGNQTVAALYVGRSEAEVADKSLSHMTRGCIIGGTALVDSTINQKPYPNTVKFTKHAKYIEWQLEELRAVMKEDKSVEAAVLSMLYLDLVKGLREQRKGQQERNDDVSRVVQRREYEMMLKAVLADGQVHPLEKNMLAEHAKKYTVSEEEHVALLAQSGWSPLDYERGKKSSLVHKLSRLDG